MPSRTVLRLLICCFLSLLLAGCLPSIVQTEHEVILVREGAEGLEILEDDDPLYETVNGEIWADAYTQYLLTLFEHTTAAIIATESPTSYSQAVSNKPFAVLDSSCVGVMHDIKPSYKNASVRSELAMGLGHDGQIDAEWASLYATRALGQLLIEVMEWPAAESCADQGTLEDETTPQRALELGYMAALEAHHRQAVPERAMGLQAQSELTSEQRAWLERTEIIPRNGYRFVFQDGEPSSSERTPEQAMRTPGVVATLFYRLHEQASGYYPQREMLWFANYEDDDRTYGQVLLPFGRIEGENASVADYIRVYVETFPAERERVITLAEQVFGADPTAITLAESP